MLSPVANAKKIWETIWESADQFGDQSGGEFSFSDVIVIRFRTDDDGTSSVVTGRSALRSNRNLIVRLPLSEHTTKYAPMESGLLGPVVESPCIHTLEIMARAETQSIATSIACVSGEKSCQCAPSPSTWVPRCFPRL